MARVWSTGFELGSPNTGVEFDNVSASGSIVTSPVRSGTYAARANPSAATCQIRKDLFTGDQASIGYARFYLRIATLPGVNTDVLRWVNAALSTVARVRLTPAGTLALLTGAGSAIGSASAALTAGVWYRVEIKNDATTSPGALEARLDGVAFASGANNVQGSWTRLDLGVLTSTSADLYFDDVAVNDASGAFQNSWPGAGSIIHLRPSSAGDSTQWTIGGGTPAATNFGSVGEASPDDATTLVHTNADARTDLYGVGASGLGGRDTVNVVAIGARFRNDIADAATAFKVQVEKTGGGTLAQSAAIVPNSATWRSNASATPFTHPLTTYQDPDGAAWKPGTLATMQIGVVSTAPGTNPVQVSGLWALVDYTPAPAGGNMTLMGV